MALFSLWCFLDVTFLISASSEVVSGSRYLCKMRGGRRRSRKWRKKRKRSGRGKWVKERAHTSTQG